MSSDYIFPKILDRYAPNTDHNQRENILAYGLPIFAGLSQIGVLAVITNTYGNNIRVVGCTEPDYNCVICWDDENEHTHQLPNCIHTACGDCYSRLMQDYNTCPICRTPF